MKDVIYLVVNRQGVQSMRKSLVDVKRGEICVKLHVDVTNDAFTPPVLEQHVAIDTWHGGVDIEDVQFNQNVITEEEAKIIKEKRIQKMRLILEKQGYKIEKPCQKCGTDDAIIDCPKCEKAFCDPCSINHSCN